MNSENFLIIFNQLLSLYQSYFSVSLSGYSIYNDGENSMAPITYRTTKKIVLNCNPKCVNQIVFQLSHELCHASIPGEVPASLRWLEETFAILASYIFPCKISSIDTEKYCAYFEHSFEMYTAKCEISSTKLSSDCLAFLEVGSGSPNYNDYGSYYLIGKNIFNSVQSHPAVWTALPYLCQIHSDMSSRDSYLEWRNILPRDISDIISIVVGPCFF